MADTDAVGFWRIAASDPEHPAVVDPDHRTATFGELAALTNRIARGLRAHGLGAGDQVTTVLPNSIEQLAIGLAAYQLGCYLTPVNWHLVGPEIAYVVADAGTSALVVHERFGAEAVRILDDCGVPESNRFAVGSVDGYRAFPELVEDHPSERPDRLATGSFMFYTSGTTGRPKGVRRRRDPRHPDEVSAESGRLLHLFGTRAHDGNVHLTQAPMYHTAVFAWTAWSLHLGHTVVLMDRWDAATSLELIERYRVTHSHMVPTMFNRLLRLPDELRHRHDLSSLRRIVHAAAPCPIETKRRMIEWWGEVIWEYYAATEGGGTYVGAAEWLERPGTVGRPWPGSEVIIVGDDGAELPPGVSGTVYMSVRSGQEFEYRGDPHKTDAARLRDYFTVGDVGYLDDDGYLFLNDRASDLIIVGGVNVYPAEIEGVLVQHEAVSDVAVFGVPNADLGEEIKAVVELRPGWEPSDDTTALIVDWLGPRLASQKRPRTIDYTDALPRDPNGKLYKRKLRDGYWRDRDRAI